MGNENPEGMLASTAVALLIPNTETREYLQNILQFVDCQVDSPESPEQLAAFLERFSSHTASVFMSSALDAGERNGWLRAIEQASPRPALIQVQEGANEEMLVSGDVLATLRLPTQFEAVSSILHRAQVFAESQLQGEGARRPVELFRSLLSMANNFDPPRPIKLTRPGRQKISSRVCASVDSSHLPA